jgi:hypothetical protein
VHIVNTVVSPGMATRADKQSRLKGRTNRPMGESTPKQSSRASDSDVTEASAAASTVVLLTATVQHIEMHHPIRLPKKHREPLTGPM